MAYESEEQSLRDFSRVFPDHAVLLLDTYDTLAALDKVIAAGLHPRGIRLDSGELVALSQEARKRLDLAGLTDTKICVSYAARGLMQRGYQISVVTDAVHHLDEFKARSFLDEVRRSGGKLIETRDLITSLLRRQAA